MYWKMAASACRLVCHFCRHIISAFRLLKSAATNDLGDHWARLDRGIIITISFAAHRWPQAIGLQLLLIIIRAILAAAIGMKKAAWWRIAEAHRHVECPNRQVLLHPVADRPADDPAAMKIKDNGEVEPAFCRPDIGDIAGRFSVS